MSRPLAGRRVVTTRERPGRLDSLLAAAGADVIHVPLIAIDEPLDGGSELRTALAELPREAWVVVTSQHGAVRVASALNDRADVRTAAVGTRTAALLEEATERTVDVVPDRQTAADLLDAMPPADPRSTPLLLAQADLADGALAAGLGDLGYAVRIVVAYRTRRRTPSAAERRAALAADALALASGSAARSWVAAIGTEAPPVVVAIGPTTQRVAAAAGLRVTAVAAQHSVEGLADAVGNALAARGR